VLAHLLGEGIRTSSSALTELLAVIREGDEVIVNRLARIGRNMVYTIQLMEEFNHCGVHFRSLDVGIDSCMTAAKIIIGMFSFLNQYERETTAKRV
jgi:DNA invertase Pin-like site-specific DNA recombinase